jgi:hypothetical protein
MKKIFIAFMAVCGFYVAQAQITGINLIIHTMPNNDPYAETDSAGVPLPYHIASVRVDFSSLAGVVKLHVKLGSSAGGSNIFNRVFELNEPGMFENGSSIAIQDNIAYLTLGAFTEQGTYYSEVKAEMGDGSFGEVYGDSSP